MNEKKGKILVLVEGGKTDYKLMTHLFDVYKISDRHEIVSYDTNIYALYDDMFCDGNPEMIDILQNLKEREKDSNRKELFNDRYSDVLLIFDLDPQDDRFSADKILKMAAFFTESSDMGKLYLNYPMVEAFYHMKTIPDYDYNTYFATKEELSGGNYKTRVNRENRNHDYRKFAVNKSECDIVIRQNIEKAFLMLNSYNGERNGSIAPDGVDILKAQMKLYESTMCVFVLCTCVFYIVDYNPNLIC